MSAYKFQVFITIGINSPRLSKVLSDTIEINNTLNLHEIDKDIFDFVLNNFYRVHSMYHDS